MDFKVAKRKKFRLLFKNIDENTSHSNFQWEIALKYSEYNTADWFACIVVAKIDVHFAKKFTQ